MLTNQFSVKTNKQNVSSLFENPSELGLWIILRARVFIFFLLCFFLLVVLFALICEADTFSKPTFEFCFYNYSLLAVKHHQCWS